MGIQASDLAKGQGAGPVAVGGEVSVQLGWNLHALKLSEQQRQVINAFDVDRFEEVVDHARNRYPKREEWSKNGFRTAFYERGHGLVLKKPRIPGTESGQRPVRTRRVRIGKPRVKEDRDHSQNP